MLFAIGRPELLASHSIAVVGTRRPTPYGMAAAERLSADLAKAGLTDHQRHGARESTPLLTKRRCAEDGETVAVFGCGVDVLYPADNRKLYQEIANEGLLLSEFPMGAPAYPQNFPIRNRIVSGLSLGVLIVEGAQYSGSAITAKLAMDQGREVFAVPGNITSKMSWGPNLAHQRRGRETGAGMERRHERAARGGAAGSGDTGPAAGAARGYRCRGDRRNGPPEPQKALARKLLNMLESRCASTT